MAERPRRHRRVILMGSPPDMARDQQEERAPSPRMGDLEERPPSHSVEALEQRPRRRLRVIWEERPPDMARDEGEERPPSPLRVALEQRPRRRRRVTWEDGPPDIVRDAWDERPPIRPRDEWEERPPDIVRDEWLERPLSPPTEILEEGPPNNPMEAVEEGPPICPRVAWEEVGAPQGVKAAVEPSEMSLIKHLELDACWFPLYEFEKARVDYIVASVKNPVKLLGQRQRMHFLQSICALCDASRSHGLDEGLDLFCQIHQLPDIIRVLLEEEPRDLLRTPLRQTAMHAITELSSMDMVVDSKETSLVGACFSSMFWLPPEEETWDCELYRVTMQAMDNMLNWLVLRCAVPRVSEVLQSIFQMLLAFGGSSRAHVRDRAVGRMAMLSHLLANLMKADPNGDGHAPYAEIQIPIMGQLLGHLVLLLSSKDEEIRHLALDALCSLFKVKYQQHCAMHPEGNALLQGDWEAKATSLRSSPSTTHVASVFGEYLQPPERTDMVLLFLEAMTDSSPFEKEAARNPLEVVTGNPEAWLVDVPKITMCIHQNVESTNVALAREKVQSVLLLMADRSPAEVVSTLLAIAPPGDSAALTLCEAMLSVPQTVQKVLKELLLWLRDSRRRLFYTLPEDRCLVRLAMLASSDLRDRALAPTYAAFRFLQEEGTAMLSVVLSAIAALAEREDMARRMKVVLPDLMGVLQQGNKAIAMKALEVFSTVMARLKTRDSSPIAAALAKCLLPFFDHELIELRQGSMSLFSRLTTMVLWSDRREMRSAARLGLLPLFFHLSDQTQSVAKAAGEALLAAAELLRWKQLKHVLRTQQPWRIGESLLQQDRSRAHEYLCQSLPYLRDAQAGLREAAVRFIGLAARAPWDPSKEELSEICSALQSLEGDTEPRICALAAQTVLILCSQRQRPRRSPRALCCWPR